MPSRNGVTSHDIGSGVKRGQLAAEAAGAGSGRPGARAAEFAVDAPDRALDALASWAVVLDALAAGRRDLHEHASRPQREPALEQLAERLQPVARCPWCSRAGRRRAGSVCGSAERRRGSRRRAGDVAARWRSPRSRRSRSRPGTRRRARCGPSYGDQSSRAVGSRAGGGRAAGSCARRRRRWKPTRSAPSMPSMISARHGSCMNSSCGRERDVQEEADAQVGRGARSIAGTSCNW